MVAGLTVPDAELAVADVEVGVCDAAPATCVPAKIAPAMSPLATRPAEARPLRRLVPAPVCFGSSPSISFSFRSAAILFAASVQILDDGSVTSVRGS
jgi:hypothetical protein